MQLPQAFLQSLAHVPGFEVDPFIAAHASNIHTSIRLNPQKPFNLNASSLSIESSVPWSSFGQYLIQRPSFTHDPIFHAGGYYVQEASSMFLEHVLGQVCDLSKPLKVLDLCAAPGGKSTLIQSVLHPDSLLVCNEVIKTRVPILIENITKWGATNAVVTNNDPAHFQRLPDYFDVIVVDTPCSGSGLFRKEPNAIDEWSENNVALCSQRQQRILHDIIPALKPGGHLIYSTCSYSEAENEVISKWLTDTCALIPLSIETNETWNIVESKKQGGYRFFPHLLKGEGFYINFFKKKGETLAPKKQKGKSAGIKPFAFHSPWIRKDAAPHFWNHEKSIRFGNAMMLEELSLLQKHLYIKKAGIHIGSEIRGEHIPDHELAMSTQLLASDIPQININKELALTYLQRANIHLDHGQQGWQLLCYDQLPIGFAKLLANRINNYYPPEWKILHAPSK